MEKNNNTEKQNENTSVENKNASPLPTLTLGSITPEIPEVIDLNFDPAVEVAPKIRDLSENLTQEEIKMTDDFANKIDISNSTHVLQYGSAPQQKIVAFSESALNKVKSKDLDTVGKMISNLVVEIKEFNPDKKEPTGFFSIFKKTGKNIDKIKSEYSTIEGNVNKIVDQLDQHKIILLKDIATLDKMYEMNLEYFQELTLYIVAGRKKLKEVNENDLPALRKKALESGSPQDAQAANDLADMCNRFEKKIYDLELTRNICLQMGPQIRLVQSNDSMMVEKIQSSITNTIPLWKNQLVLTLGLVHSKKAIEAQREVTDVTNQLLRENSQKLKTSTIESAKESERGIVDIETLQETNRALIETLDEVMIIQREGHQRRLEAEFELQRIEDELKARLLKARDEA